MNPDQWADVRERLRRSREDEGAWRAIEEAILIWARSDLRDLGAEALQDVVADTRLSVFRKLDNVRTSLKGFVIGEYKNVKQRYVGGPLFVRIEDADRPDYPDFDAAEGDESGIAALRACLEVLPSRDRDVVLLHNGEGATYRVIAAKLRITEGNARKIACLARERLRLCVEGKLRSPTGNQTSGAEPELKRSFRG